MVAALGRKSRAKFILKTVGNQAGRLPPAWGFRDFVSLIPREVSPVFSKSSSVDPLWKWRDVLKEDLRNAIAAAVQATLAYAQLSAWSYLHDTALTGEIVEEAIERVHSYALCCSPPPSQAKLTARLRSQVRRIAKQRANLNSKEIYAGELYDLELYAPSFTPDPTQTLLIGEVLERLSPQAQKIADWIWMGYSWREIGKAFEIDHNCLRLAFRRETDAALIQLGHGTRARRSLKVC